ncbi:MAG: FecR domain-containing protein [Treponema sp.]|nr:FecR domain-containing protein [Treponema sp.]
MKMMILAMLVSGGALFAQEAYIREYTGTVEVQAPGAAWTAAAAGMPITGDTRISTGFKSTAVIVTGNSTLLLRPLTRLTLEELRKFQGDEDVRFYLQSGRVKADVHPPEGGTTNFTVRSPVATASVRGTSFEFDGVNLRTGEGLVHVTGRDGAGVYVGAGHKTVSDPETGRTAGTAETAQAELTPAASVPAFADTAPEPAAIMPRMADAAVNFEWE